MLTETQRNRIIEELGENAFFEKETNNLIFTIKKENSFLEEDYRFKMIFVKGGKFKNAEISPFYLAEFPLTQELYKAISNDNPSEFSGIMHPVEQVSWEDAVAFIHRLNKLMGFSPICDKDYQFLDTKGKKTKNIAELKGFRLPTEAEWVYAAQGAEAGKEKVYAGSNTPDTVAWYDDNNYVETRSVGLKYPNALGLYDMSGNVWEWCWDFYSDEFFNKLSGKNPVNLENGSFRILRGGSWNFNGIYAKLANRLNFNPDNRWNINGFRLAYSSPVLSSGQKGSNF